MKNKCVTGNYSLETTRSGRKIPRRLKEGTESETWRESRRWFLQIIVTWTSIGQKRASLRIKTSKVSRLILTTVGETREKDVISKFK